MTARVKRLEQAITEAVKLAAPEVQEVVKGLQLALSSKEETNNDNDKNNPTHLQPLTGSLHIREVPTRGPLRSSSPLAAAPRSGSVCRTPCARRPSAQTQA
jgi:hypothetical protein